MYKQIKEEIETTYSQTVQIEGFDKQGKRSESDKSSFCCLYYLKELRDRIEMGRSKSLKINQRLQHL